MTLIIILICLAVQRWLEWDRYKRKSHWFQSYYEWIYARVGDRSFWPGIGGVILIVLPILVLYVLVATGLYYGTTRFGYNLLSLVILWYAMDARPIQSYVKYTDQPKTMEIQESLASVYQRIFALLFWFLILRATGVIIYALVVQLLHLLEKSEYKDIKSKTLLSSAEKVRAVLDWVPLRLLGLLYALAGNFSAVFKMWRETFWSGLSYAQEEAVTYGMVALGMDFDQRAEPQTAEIARDIDALVNRALGILLFIIAIISIGIWVG